MDTPTPATAPTRWGWFIPAEPSVTYEYAHGWRRVRLNEPLLYVAPVVWRDSLPLAAALVAPAVAGTACFAFRKRWAHCAFHLALVPFAQALADAAARGDHLCELNVVEQVANVCQTTMVQDAWERGQDLTVHGWVYGLRDGLVRDLEFSATSADEATTRYVTALASLD
jgi:hypothetical protein